MRCWKCPPGPRCCRPARGGLRLDARLRGARALHQLPGAGAGPGAAYLGALTAAEVRYRAAGPLAPDERLACQVRLPAGDVRGRVPVATQLPTSATTASASGGWGPKAVNLCGERAGCPCS